MRDADVIVLRQEHQQAARNTDLPRQARALASHGLFENLHHQCLPLEELSFDRLHGRRRRRRQRSGRLRIAVCMAAIDAAHQIGHMQKSGAVQSDIDKCRLHARKHTHHLTQVHIAHQTALKRAFNLQFLHRAVFNHGNPRFLRRPVNQDVLLHCLPES